KVLSSASGLNLLLIACRKGLLGKSNNTKSLLAILSSQIKKLGRNVFRKRSFLYTTTTRAQERSRSRKQVFQSTLDQQKRAFRTFNRHRHALSVSGKFKSGVGLVLRFVQGVDRRDRWRTRNRSAKLFD